MKCGETHDTIFSTREVKWWIGQITRIGKECERKEERR